MKFFKRDQAGDKLFLLWLLTVSLRTSQRRWMPWALMHKRPSIEDKFPCIVSKRWSTDETLLWRSVSLFSTLETSSKSFLSLSSILSLIPRSTKFNLISNSSLYFVTRLLTDCTVPFMLSIVFVVASNALLDT